MAETLVYPKGSIITFTSGEYSDFGIIGYVVTVKDCDLPKRVAEFIAETGKRPEQYCDDLYGFVTWLVTKQYAMPVDTSEVWLGAYSSWNTELLK